jgi:hypothetical protein
LTATAVTWAELAARTDVQPGWYSTRLVSPASLNLFLAVRKPDNTPGMLFEVRSSSVPADFAIPESVGFDFEVEPVVRGPGGTTRLSIRLRRPEFREVFGVLVEDVVRAVERAGTEPAGIRSMVGRLRIWQTFFRTQGSEGLTVEVLRGLMGELMVLRDHLLPVVGARSVGAWEGPRAGIHDFRFAPVSLEVKSTARLPSPPFSVNGLDQLDERRVPVLVLAHVQLTRRPDGASLSEVIGSTRALVETLEPALLVDFDDLLIETGYLGAHASRYEGERYRCESVRFYGVAGGFPRLTRAVVPPGVVEAAYEVAPSACEPYELPAAAVHDLLRQPSRV